MMAILAVELDVGSGDVPRILIFGTALGYLPDQRLICTVFLYRI